MQKPSPEQETVITKTGRFVLRACPGSGKTFTVAYRFAERMKGWRISTSGIAALSFTNVAQSQISSELVSLGLAPNPPFPHFLGTIDHFINSQIFLPFGHLVMGCVDRPSIVGMQSSIWNQEEHALFWRVQRCHACRLEKITYNIQGNLIGGLVNCPFNYQHCQNLKLRFNRMGFASQSDAEYWAMLILQRYPGIAKSLAKRFPEMIIDEAQDTSDIQMRIIDLLVINGLAEVMLVGDSDQAIYEWRDARPDIFIEKLNEKGWGNPIDLNQNRRSSQLICNLTKNFSASLQNISQAVGADSNFALQPKLISYDSNQISALKDDFINLCERTGIGISPNNIAVLVRANRQLLRLRNIINVGDPWNHTITRLIAQAAYYRDIKELAKSRSYLETALSRILFGNQFISKHDMEQKVDSMNLNPRWSLGLWQLLRLLPESGNSLRLWLVDATRILHIWFDSHTSWLVPERNELTLRVKRFQMIDGHRFIGYFEEPVSRFFNDPELVVDGITIETIHSAKGKTYEAVLYIVNDSTRGKGNIRHIAERDLSDEEVRTAYVAMTRPRKILVIAIPNGTEDKILRKRFPDWIIEQKDILLREYG